MMARNEEEMISETISYIRNQTIPPTRIHVLNDGSTDSTGLILDGMKDLTITHVPPHPPQHSEKPFNERQHKLMQDAAKGVDYVLCMDADTEIPSDYMERITNQMELDDVVVASGMDASNPCIMPKESGMVINVKRLRQHDNLPLFTLPGFAIQSIIDGHPSIAYTTIPLHYKRELGKKYSKNVLMYRGKDWRMYGLLFPFLMYKAIRVHSFRLFWGYVSYNGEKMPKLFQEWTNDYHIERLKCKLGLNSWMFRKTDMGLFVLPKNYAQNHSQHSTV